MHACTHTHTHTHLYTHARTFTHTHTLTHTMCEKKHLNHTFALHTRYYMHTHNLLIKTHMRHTSMRAFPAHRALNMIVAFPLSSSLSERIREAGGEGGDEGEEPQSYTDIPASYNSSLRPHTNAAAAVALFHQQTHELRLCVDLV